MIRILSLFLTVWAASSSLASADVIRVRSGEHDGFTRIVLDMERLPEWRAGKTAEGYAVGFGGEALLAADLSQAFRLIGRNRVASMRYLADAREFHIALACDCAAEVFALRDRSLVIDIRSAAAGPWANAEAPFAPALPAPDVLSVVAGLSGAPVPVSVPERRQPFADVIHSVPAPRLAVPAAEPHFFAPPGPPAVAMSSDAPIRSRAEHLGDTVIPPESTAVAELSRQLARAVSQGLISASDTPPSGSPRAGGLTAPASANFRALTGIDRDTRRLSASIDSTARGVACIPESRVSLADWGDPTDATVLGRLRREAMSEDGNPTDAGRLQLARHYIALGFGAEARVALAGLPDGPDRDIVLEMAEILDVGRSDGGVFAGQSACPGSVSLWAILSAPVVAADLPVNTDAMLAAFSALPLHLREHLGPLFSKRLQAAGQTDLARMALNAVTRSGGGSIRQDLTAARLGLSGTDAEDSRIALEDLSRGTDFTAAEALIELLLDARRRGVAPRAAWVDDADTLVRATKGTEIAERLTIAALWGHIPLERFDVLRRRLVELPPGMTEAIRRDLSVAALEAAVAVAPDDVFLRSEIGFSDYAEPGTMRRPLRLALGSRLMSLSLPGRAQRYEERIPETPDETVLAAQIRLELGDAAAAADLVARLEDPETGQLRASIFMGDSRLKKAVTAYLQADGVAQANRAAMITGDWDWVADADLGTVSEAVAALRDPKDQGARDERPDNGALIATVAQRRAAIAALLDATVVTAPR